MNSTNDDSSEIDFLDVYNIYEYKKKLNFTILRCTHEKPCQ